MIILSYLSYWVANITADLFKSEYHLATPADEPNVYFNRCDNNFNRPDINWYFGRASDKCVTAKRSNVN